MVDQGGAADGTVVGHDVGCRRGQNTTRMSYMVSAYAHMLFAAYMPSSCGVQGVVIVCVCVCVCVCVLL